MTVRLSMALWLLLVLGSCGESAPPELPRDPEKSAQLLAKAVAYLGEGKNAHASKELEKAVQADHQNAEALYQLGLCYQGFARNLRAIECFEQALAADPSHARAHVEAGRMLCRLLDFERGLPLLERAITLSPEDHVAFFYLGAALLDARRFVEASERLTRAVELYPGFSGAWFHLGKARLELEDLSGAREAFEQCLELRPSHRGALLQLARLEERSEEAEAAERHRTLLRLVTEIDQLGRRGMLGAEDELRRALQEALRFDPRNYDLQIQLGDWHREHGDKEQALRRYEAAQQLAPDRPQPYRRLADIYQLLGREARARSAAMRHQQLYREDPQD